MPSPSTPLLDDFNRADTGPPASSNWSNDPGSYGASGHKIVSNECRGNANPWNHSWWNAGVYAPDSEVWITVATLPFSNDERVEVGVRAQDVGTPFLDAYEFQWKQKTAGTDEWYLFRKDNGGQTQLGATITGPDLAAGDGIWLEAIGDTLNGYRRNAGTWTLVGTRTDSTFGSGYLLLYNDDTFAHLDDFGGGPIGSNISTTYAEDFGGATYE